MTNRTPAAPCKVYQQDITRHIKPVNGSYSGAAVQAGGKLGDAYKTPTRGINGA